MSWELENWETISIETAKLYFQEAIEGLKETAESAKIVTNRGWLTMNILITLAILLIGFTTSQAIQDNFGLLFQLGILVILFILASGFFMFKTIRTYHINTPGTPPQYMATPELNKIEENETQQQSVLIAMLGEYQRRIDDNVEKNGVRIRHYKKALHILFSTIPAIVLYIVQYFIFWVF